ncbi:MAG: YebC/PmpR family DNA-binding transcriptional regulator [Gemmatimonadetes bacterium]|nr:YebC/PmpR family DNA-binding transcriptional regulator [Gemmatimonadota bacterium]
MAGHNKWSQIKRKKAVNDQKRGQMFTKLIRELTVAAREGGGDPNFNPRLRLGVDAAKAANMPQENIDRAIKRGTGELEGVTYEEVVYEGYGPGGVALYIETLTDNQKRTVAEVRHLLDKNGGNLGTAGSVAWQFDRKGMIYIGGAGLDEDTVFEAAVDAGAEDVSREAEEYVVSTEPGDLHEVRRALGAAGLAVESAHLAMVARNEVGVTGKSGERILRLLEALDDHDDVQQVYSNADLDESVLARAL